MTTNDAPNDMNNAEAVAWAIGFDAGAASRDAEVVSLTNQRDYEYVRAENAEQERDQFEQVRDQLRAHINILRDAFQTFIDEHEECQDADEWMAELCSIEALHVAGEALDTTPEQSLAEYRNKVIEECAKRAEAYAYMSQNFNALAEELRAMKEQP